MDNGIEFSQQIGFQRDDRIAGGLADVLQLALRVAVDRRAGDLKAVETELRRLLDVGQIIRLPILLNQLMNRYH